MKVVPYRDEEGNLTINLDVTDLDDFKEGEPITFKKQENGRYGFFIKSKLSGTTVVDKLKRNVEFRNFLQGIYESTLPKERVRFKDYEFLIHRKMSYIRGMTISLMMRLRVTYIGGSTSRKYCSLDEWGYRSQVYNKKRRNLADDEAYFEKYFTVRSRRNQAIPKFELIYDMATYLIEKLNKRVGIEQ